MKITKKRFSLLLCIMMIMSFVAIPTSVFAATTQLPPPAVKPTQATTDKTTQATTKKPTQATTTTTKGTTATTARKTTAKKPSSNNNSGSGKLTVSSKRSTEGSGEGGKVKVIYTINNTGDVTAKNIKLKDPDIAGSKTIEQISSLSPGDSKTIEYEATMTRDSTSTPTATCTMNGSSKTFTGESVKISLTGNASSSLSATLTTTATAIQPNAPVKFSLLLKNDDTSKLTDITISDYAGKALKSGISIEPGSSTNVDFELTLTGDTNVYVNVKGKNASGQEVSVKSNELAMKADANAVPVTEGITALIHADKTELDKKGTVALTLEIKNLMPKAFTNVAITDKATGANIQSISLLSGNDSKTYTSNLTVEENTSFLYEVTATYEDGTAITIQSNSLEIKVGSQGLFKGGMGIILVIVIVVVILIIATSITLFVLSKKEKEQKKSIGAAQSEKYKKATPKKKSKDKKMPPPPPKPMSTFDIEEDDNSMNIPSLNTTPIQIPKSSSGFDDNNLSMNDESQFDEEESFNENSYQQQEGFNDFSINSVDSEGMPEEHLNDIPAEQPQEQQYYQPEQPQEQQYYRSEQPQGPMNYNDLDPD